MKYLITATSAATLLVLTGCATSSKVQEMIDTTHQDYLNKSAQYESSIAVLKKSASAVLIQNRAQEKKLAELRKELEEACTQEELLDAILNDAIADGWKKITKAGSVSSVLAQKSHKEMFPLELDKANIHLNGDTVGFRSAGVDVIEAQERAYIDNKIKQDQAFARNMSVIGPVRSLMLEQQCSSGEALDILREREE